MSDRLRDDWEKSIKEVKVRMDCRAIEEEKEEEEEEGGGSYAKL
jgi:hypothetical protein